MSLIRRPVEDKFCFVYCGKDRCNCRRGNPDTDFVMLPAGPVLPDIGTRTVKPEEMKTTDFEVVNDKGMGNFEIKTGG